MCSRNAAVRNIFRTLSWDVFWRSFWMLKIYYVFHHFSHACPPDHTVRNVFGASSFLSVPPLGLHVGNLGRYSRSRNPGRPRPFKIEPANVTMELHMGVAWQALIQDVVSLCYRAGSWVWVEQQALNQIIPPTKWGSRP